MRIQIVKKADSATWMPSALTLAAGLALACSVDARDPNVAAPPESVVPTSADGNPAQGDGSDTPAGDTTNDATEGAPNVTQLAGEGATAPRIDGAPDGTAPTCTPGQTRCASPSEMAECGSDGTWAAAMGCAFACLGTACGGECVPGSSECLSTTEVRTCSPEALWSVATTCENSCVGTACAGECVAGSSECFSPRQVRSCGPEGQWQPVMTCPAVCAEGACGGVCIPQTRRCNPDSGLPELCADDGSWFAEGPCPFVCSGDGECTGECETGSFRCNGSALQRCVDARWTLAEQCLTAAHCHADDATCVGNDCADDANPRSTVVSDPNLGCGLSWQFPEDPTGAWIEFDSGLHFDTETGAAWKHPFESGSYDLASLAAGCASLEVEGVGGWRVPTIDEARELGAGCAPTEPGGDCAVSDPSCLAQSCGGCSSCLGGTASSGREEDDLYCRPNTRICDNLHTSSICSDCPGDQYWEFGIVNGNILPRETSVRITGSYCIRPNFPLL